MRTGSRAFARLSLSTGLALKQSEASTDRAGRSRDSLRARCARTPAVARRSRARWPRTAYSDFAHDLVQRSELRPTPRVGAVRREPAAAEGASVPAGTSMDGAHSTLRSANAVRSFQRLRGAHAVAIATFGTGGQPASRAVALHGRRRASHRTAARQSTLNYDAGTQASRACRVLSATARAAPAQAARCSGAARRHRAP